MIDFRALIDSVRTATLNEAKEAVEGMKSYEKGRVLREGRIPNRMYDESPDKPGVMKDLTEGRSMQVFSNDTLKCLGGGKFQYTDTYGEVRNFATPADVRRFFADESQETRDEVRAFTRECSQSNESREKAPSKDLTEGLRIRQVGSNMTEVTTAKGDRILFSYNTPVAAQMADGSYIRTEKKWSVTTSSHIGKWLAGASASSVPQEKLDSLTESIRKVKESKTPVGNQPAKKAASKTTLTGTSKVKEGRLPPADKAPDSPESRKALTEQDEPSDDEHNIHWESGDKLRVKGVPPALLSSYPASGITGNCVVTAKGPGFVGGLDVFDVLTKEGEEDSIYGFQVVGVVSDATESRKALTEQDDEPSDDEDMQEGADENEEPAAEASEEPIDLEHAEDDLEAAEDDLEGGDVPAALDAIDNAEADIDAAEGEECPCMDGGELTADTVIEAAPELADKDLEQVEMGIEDEAVHSDDPALVGQIVNDHLEELPNWYTVVNAAIEAELAKDEDLMAESKKTGKRLKALKNMSIKERRLKESTKANEDFSVVVGNVGNIACKSRAEAEKVFKDYVEQSKSGNGRAGGEDVTLMVAGEPVKEHAGTVNESTEDSAKLNAGTGNVKNPKALTQGGSVVEPKKDGEQMPEGNKQVKESKTPVGNQSTKKVASRATLTGTGKVRESQDDIYAQLKAAGVPLDHHETDLYAKVTPESEKIVAGYASKSHVKKFIDQIDKELWFDIPFAYTPAWHRKQTGAAVKESAEEGVKTPVGNQPSKTNASPAKETGIEKPSEGDTTQKTSTENQQSKKAADGARLSGTEKVGDTGVTLKVNTPSGNQPVKAGADPVKATGTEKVSETKQPVGNQPAKKAASPVKVAGTEKVKESAYQPKTGSPCSCRPGQQRDNCPQCEGTGQRIDFAAIRAKTDSKPSKVAGTEKVKEAVDPTTRKVLASGVADEAIAKEAAQKFNGVVVPNADGKTWDVLAKAESK